MDVQRLRFVIAWLFRKRWIRRFAVTILTLSLVITPYFVARVGTKHTYFGWTGEGPPDTAEGLRVAIVKPVFSATAYSASFGGSDSFYQFYTKHGNDPTQNITTDLNLLNVSVVDGWGWSMNLSRYITEYVGDHGTGAIAAHSFTTLSDINVTEGGLFNPDGSSQFDVVVLGFTEYVTSEEYYGYQRFVAMGGRLVMMDASSFVAEVKYYPQTNHLALVRGHHWGFNGKTAWHDVCCRWENENTNWVGSSQCCTTRYTDVSCDAWLAQRYYNGAGITGNYPISAELRRRFGSQVFECYMGHEENSVKNFTGTTILALWQASNPDPQNTIAAYLHHYVNGTVVDIGVMSSDIVDQDISVQFFLIGSIEDSIRT